MDCFLAIKLLSSSVGQGQVKGIFIKIKFSYHLWPLPSHFVEVEFCILETLLWPGFPSGASFMRVLT